MKKAIKTLWLLSAISIVAFVVGLFVAGSDEMRWRIFSIAMPLAAIGFYGAIILTVIDYVRSRK